MRVVMVAPSYPPREITCGVGDYSRCLVEALVDDGDQVTVVAASGRHRSPDDRAPVLAVLGGARGGGRALVSVTRKLQPDLLHLQYTPDLYRRRRSLLGAATALRAAGNLPAVVATAHSLVDGSLASKLAAGWLLGVADITIAASPEVAALARRRLPALAHRVRHVPIGSNIVVAPAPSAEERSHARASLGVSSSAPLLVHFGLVYPGKGLETLVEALPHVLAAAPAARLVVVGDTRPADRPYRAGLEALAERRGVAAAVVWAGRREPDEVSRLLHAADLFVVPYDGGASLRRGSLLAGLAHGRPVVTTHGLDVPSCLRDGETVALVPARNPAALASRVLTLLIDRATAGALGAGGRRVLAGLGWAEIASATREAYREACARRGSRVGRPAPDWHPPGAPSRYPPIGSSR